MTEQTVTNVVKEKRISDSAAGTGSSPLQTKRHRDFLRRRSRKVEGTNIDWSKVKAKTNTNRTSKKVTKTIVSYKYIIGTTYKKLLYNSFACLNLCSHMLYIFTFLSIQSNSRGRKILLPHAARYQL